MNMSMMDAIEEEYEDRIVVLNKRITDLEAEYLNEKRKAAKAYTACGNYQQQIGELETDKENLRLYASGLENAQNLINVRFRNLQTEMQEVANQLMDLYDNCVETTEPEVFGTILGLHERLETALK